MADYSEVPPPTATVVPSFQDAVRLARERAAKLVSESSKGLLANATDNNRNGEKKPAADDQNEREQPVKRNRSRSVESDERSEPPSKRPDTRRLGLGAGEDSEEMFIPQNMVLEIMGTDDSNRKKLEAQSGAKLELLEDSDKPKLRISGSKRNLSFLRSLVEDILKKTAYPTATSEANGFSGGDSQSPATTIMVPSHKVGLIIGRGGEKIKELQSKSGARIQIVQQGISPSAVEKPVEITGDSYTVQVAQDMIYAIINDNYGNQNNSSYGNNSYGGNGSYGGNNSSREDGSQREVTVPRGAVGLVIGRGGDTIKRMQIESGAHIQLQTDNGGPDRVVMIKGTEESIVLAEQKVNAILEEYRERQQNGNTRSSSNTYSSSSYQSQQPGSLTTSVKIIRDKVGLVIGRGGETIKWIQQTSGARVQLNRNIPQDASEKEFTVSGLPEQVQYATQLINEKAGVSSAADSQQGYSATPAAYDYSQYQYGAYQYPGYGQQHYYGAYTAQQQGDQKSGDASSTTDGSSATTNETNGEVSESAGTASVDYSSWYAANSGAPDPSDPSYGAWYASQQAWYGAYGAQTGYYNQGYDAASGAVATNGASESKSEEGKDA
eukprot:Nk52_evm13s248 gene=Nk52_evmTU13s248